MEKIRIMKPNAKTGVHLIELKRRGIEEFFITILPLEINDFHSAIACAAKIIQEKKALIIHQDIFGMHCNEKKKDNALKHVYGNVEWPVTHICGLERNHNGLVGTILHAVRGVNVKRIRNNGTIVGSFFEQDDFSFCRLGGITPEKSKSEVEQAEEIFYTLESSLSEAGMDFSCMARTWMYLDNILNWYDSFNQTRFDFYEKRGIMDGVIPASTGIGTRNSLGTAIVAGALAIKGKDVSIKSVQSPLQHQPMEYGSSFSRAVEVVSPGQRRLLISGTASISASGKTIYQGDIRGQVKCTLEVVRAILESRDMDWNNMVQSIAYFRNVEDALILNQYLAENHIPPIPVLAVNNEICRDDLMFEVELDAIAES